MRIESHAAALFETIGVPAWLTGFLWHGVYRGLAWVVAVMLPPMAIFFPMFTILENLGYLPRVAFNLDRLFQRVGAHGKQALTMSMGFGCNAAGVDRLPGRSTHLASGSSPSSRTTSCPATAASRR